MAKCKNGLKASLNGSWLSGVAGPNGSFAMNIEQVFHLANFDVEVHRLRQHLAPVGRKDGPGTPWNAAEDVEHWLSLLEDALRDVIVEQEDQADLAPITRWAKTVDHGDTVVTFNYDTLVERALSEVGMPWNHGFVRESGDGIGVCKLHGSIDWIVANRTERLRDGDLLFDKKNTNRSRQVSGHVEEDYLLWRCRTRDQLRNWIRGRDLQAGTWKTVGIAGLGAYKPLHRIPGLGPVWVRGMKALNEADFAIVVGFSMSEFDAMAQMQMAEVARNRHETNRPLRVKVIDPFIKADGEVRFRRVFRHVEFVILPHEKVDWACI